jgi:AraC-like DNA-binding protein
MRTLGNPHRHFHVAEQRAALSAASVRVAVVWRLPAILAEFGVDLRDALDAAGLPKSLFDDPENRIGYPAFGQLLLACEQLTRCDHIVLQITQQTRLANFGLAGQYAFCGATVGEGLQNLVDQFNLHSTASIISLITTGDFARLAYAIAAPNMTVTRPFQLGAMTMALNILQDLCGPGMLPAVVTFASGAPSNLRPLHKHFRAPLRFDSEESALIFERRWLDRALPPIDPDIRRQVESQVRSQQDQVLQEFPTTVRLMLRKQLLIGECSMDGVAALLGMHRRTVDRHLQRHGVSYSELLESVQKDMARQLLLDTQLQVQQVAEALHFSSAANFATAFRRWTGMTPSEYRRQAS